MQPATTSPRALLVVLCGAGVVVSLMHTLIVPLVPELPTTFDTDPSTGYWAVTATLLAAAVMTPITGRLGDMFGKQRMLVVALIVLLVGSVTCALSQTIEMMIVGRALQGAASGAIALGISILRDELPRDRVGPAVALMSSSMGLGGAFGMPVAAVIADQADWHALFWISAAVTLLCLLAVLRWVPESPVRTPGRIDFVGVLGLAVGLVALMVVITRGNEWGWVSAAIVTLAVVAVVVFPLWGWWELRVDSPLVDLRVSARPQVLFTNIASIAVGFALYGTSLVCIQMLMAPQEVGYGQGLSMVQAGLALAPGGFAMFFCSRLGATLSAAKGPRTSLLVGIVVLVVGYGQGVLWHDAIVTIALCNLLISSGVGIAFAAMPALIMGAVPISETAAANGLNSLMRSLGTTSSSAVVAAVLAASTVSLGPALLPSESAISNSLLVCLGASVVAFFLALLIPRSVASDLDHPAGERDGTSQRSSGELVEERPGRVVAPEA